MRSCDSAQEFLFIKFSYTVPGQYNTEASKYCSKLDCEANGNRFFFSKLRKVLAIVPNFFLSQILLIQSSQTEIHIITENATLKYGRAFSEQMSLFDALRETRKEWSSQIN